MSTWCNCTAPTNSRGCLLAPDNQNLLVRIGGRGSGSLASKLPKAHVGKLERYRCGFLANYGYFRKHSGLRNEGAVTFIQAYNAAAKMARPTALTSFPTAIFCRLYEAAWPRYEDSTRAAVQSMTALLDYYHLHVRRNAHLRIEEVHTIDSSTCRGTVSDEIQRLGSCNSERTTHALAMLLDSKLIYRVADWQRHVDETVGEELDTLANLAEHEPLSQLPAQREVIPLSLLTFMLRSEFRLHYFAHGRNYNFNYAMVRHMLIGDSEAKATVGEWIRVRPARQEDDSFVLPLYSPKTPTHLAQPIRCLWNVRHILGDAATADQLTYAVTAYTTWAYATYIVYGFRQIAKREVDFAEVAADVIATEDLPFSIHSLLTAAATAGRATTVRIAGTTRQPETLVKQLLHRPGRPLRKPYRAPCRRSTTN